MNRHVAQTRLAERRLSFERRSFVYSNHLPERRTGRDRRETPMVAAVPARSLSHMQPGGKERSSAVFKIVSSR